MTEPRIDKGAAEVMRALTGVEPLEPGEALELQRELFRAEFGCYPEECTVVAVEDMTVEEVRALGGHPDRPDAR